MELKLERELRTEFFTQGKLSVDGVFECWTLEDTERDLKNGCGNKIKGKTAIPSGRYRVILSYSNRFKKHLPEVLQVSCFEGIRIHSGNTPEDTEGCILVGKEKTAGGQIFQSRAAFGTLMLKLVAAETKEKIYITVV